jgi:hypothetical protein
MQWVTVSDTAVVMQRSQKDDLYKLKQWTGLLGPLPVTPHDHHCSHVFLDVELFKMIVVISLNLPLWFTRPTGWMTF